MAKKSKHPKHYHDWNYVHTVYGGRESKSSEVCVRRYCSGCKLEQHAYANRWYRSSIGPKGRFDEKGSLEVTRAT